MWLTEKMEKIISEQLKVQRNSICLNKPSVKCWTTETGAKHLIRKGSWSPQLSSVTRLLTDKWVHAAVSYLCKRHSELKWLCNCSDFILVLWQSTLLIIGSLDHSHRDWFIPLYSPYTWLCYGVLHGEAAAPKQHVNALAIRMLTGPTNELGNESELYAAFEARVRSTLVDTLRSGKLEWKQAGKSWAANKELFDFRDNYNVDAW